MILDDLRWLIETRGIATFGTDLFIGRMPEAPDSVVGIFEYAGLQPISVHNRLNSTIKQPRAQVQVRDPDYQLGRQRAQAVFEVFETQVNTVINGVAYYRIIPLQEPFFLHRDENERIVFVFNSQAQKE